jgi:hypothetical protein
MCDRRVVVAILVIAASVTWPTAAHARGKPYTPKNGLLNWKALVFGGGFRVTTAIPVHGDFSQFVHVEIAQAESLIGPDVPRQFLRRLSEQLAGEFKKGGRFEDVTLIDSYEARATGATIDVTSRPSLRNADSLDAPMRTADDLSAIDRERASAARASAARTLVVRSEVIDYAGGNKFAQLLFLNLGNAVVTVRLSYFDKTSGDELGRSVISSDNSSKVVPSVLSPRTVLNGIAEGVVDQVTRRKVAAEQ